MRIFFKWIVALQVLVIPGLYVVPVRADCGCNGDAYMKIMYTERKTGEQYETYVIDYSTAWSMMYGFGAANSPQRDMSQLISKYPKELLLMEGLSKGATFRVVEQISTPLISLKNNQQREFTFILRSEKYLNYLNVRSID